MTKFLENSNPPSEFSKTEFSKTEFSKTEFSKTEFSKTEFSKNSENSDPVGCEAKNSENSKKSWRSLENSN